MLSFAQSALTQRGSPDDVEADSYRYGMDISGFGQVYFTVVFAAA
jgi:hypothetical protein